MVIPRSYSFYWAVMLALLFFTFSDGKGILPVDYVYVMFILTAFFVAPFLLRKHVDRRALWVTCALLGIGSLSSFGSGVPSAFLYSIGPIFLLLTASNPTVFKSERHQQLSVKWICSILLVCGTIAFPFMEPNYHNRFFLPYVGNPNYTAMLYLTVFIFVQVSIPILQRHWRIYLSIVSYIVLLTALYKTETRSVALAFVFYLIFGLVIELGYNRSVRLMAVALVIFTVTGQLIAYYMFSSVEVETTARSTIGFFDASNLSRVNAFYTAFTVALSDPAFVWHGVGNVDGIWDILAASGKVDHVPHNWFMMMWLSNGAIFTILIVGILIAGAKQLPIYAIPGYAALLVISLIMGRSALFAPLCLFLIGCLFRNKPSSTHSFYSRRDTQKRLRF